MRLKARGNQLHFTSDHLGSLPITGGMISDTVSASTSSDVRLDAVNTFVGAASRDSISGSPSNDNIYVYRSVADARDLISTAVAGDRIDLSALAPLEFVTEFSRAGAAGARPHWTFAFGREL